MYIDKLSLRNFKCFEKVDISFSKITLLTGPNSSGKSSLLYGLLGPLQSSQFPLYLSPNGKYVKMGDYKEMVFKHIVNRHIGIDIEARVKNDKNKYCLKTDWIADKQTMMPKLLYLENSTPTTEAKISTSKSTGQYIFNLKYDPKKFLEDEGSELLKAMSPFLKLLDKYAEKITTKKKRKSTKVRVNLLKPYVLRGRRFNSIQELNEKFYSLPQFLFFPPVGIVDINFISSFRREPQSTYHQTSPSGKKLDKYGEDYINQILQWEKQKHKKFEELKSVLRELKLLFSLKSKQLTGGRFELHVKVKRAGLWTLLIDVGFGISQLLPFLVADLQLSSSSTLFVAQPEIHLHPSAQASLSDYFVKQIKKKQKRYILETHSEYLINRIRLAIAKRKIEPGDVSVYYFENTLGGSHAYKVSFTKDGRIENAPKSFFDTYMIDTMEIALNAK
ncbi:MAG: DUF3696 domain-containing protein [Planctomycetota bacterium]|jgi:predicted ATPase